MKTSVTINIDNDLLMNVASLFGEQQTEDYSKVIENALLYFLRPQLVYVNKQTVDDKIELLQQEPTINIEDLQNNYTFKISDIEGKWPGDESIEELVKLLSK